MNLYRKNILRQNNNKDDKEFKESNYAQVKYER